MGTNVNIGELTNYPIIESYPLPGNSQVCLVIAKSEASRCKHFDSYLIGYAGINKTHLSLKRFSKDLEFRELSEAKSHAELMLSQE